MIIGFLGVLIFKFVIPNFEPYGIYFNNIAELAPAMILGLLAGYIFSKLYPNPELEREFDELYK